MADLRKPPPDGRRGAEPGATGRRPTIEDVARASGVSRGTVSRFLNGGTYVSPRVAVVIQRSIDELGYTANAAARALRSGRSDVIAYLFASGADQLFDDPNHASFIRSFSRALRTTSRHLLVAAAADESEEALMAAHLCAGHVDGIVIHHPAMNAELFNQLVRASKPAVIIGKPIGYESILSWVAVDDEAGAYQLTRLLVRNGRLPAAIITGPLRTSGGRERLQGFRRALGRRFDPSLVASADWTDTSAERATEELLAARPDIQGLFVSSDVMALGALRALERTGRRPPGNVAVVSFDDSPAATAANPQLTTCRNRVSDCAVEAAMLLDMLLDGRLQEPQHVLLPAELVVRASV